MKFPPTLKVYYRLSIFIGILSYTFSPFCAQARVNSQWDNQESQDSQVHWQDRSYNDIEEIRQVRTLHEKESDLKNIQLGKWMLINGELEKALHYFQKVDTNQSDLRPITLRYRAIIDFILERYENALAHLEDPVFNDARYLKEVCGLKTVLLIIETPPVRIEGDLRNRDQIMQDRRNLRDTISFCRSFNAQYSKSLHYWLNNIEKISFGEEETLKGANISDIRFILERPEMVRVWLKTGLFTNNEHLIERHLNVIPGDFFRYQFFRELMGMHYYRLGNSERALSFIEDIETANADNIRGNINLKEGQYELAFGHFQLALQKKSNSRNALERAVPLAWILEQWSDGQEMLTRMVHGEYNHYKKETLDTAFHIRQNEIDIADRKLRNLESHYQAETPHLIDLMISYVALQKGQMDRMLNFSHKACRDNDGLNCWILQQTLLWDDISRTVKREDTPFQDFSIAQLRAPQKITPIEDTPYINQDDIEELDSQQVDLPFEVRLESHPQ